MRKVALFAIVILVTGTSARSDVQKLSESGFWAAHAGVRDDGKFICALVTGTLDGSGGQFIIEKLLDDETLSIRLLKPTWNLPPGKRTNVIIQFGFIPTRWNIPMYGSGHEIRGELPWGRVSDFMSGFRGSGRIDVTFPSGTETPWQLGTAGEGIVEADFMKWLKMNLRPQTTAPTQP